jgi:hypothetical protein
MFRIPTLFTLMLAALTGRTSTSELQRLAVRLTGGTR